MQAAKSPGIPLPVPLAKLGRTLFNSEFHIDEKYRPWVTALLFVFAIGYPFSFLGLMQHVAYLGPGLGDDWNLAPFLLVMEMMKTNPVAYMAFMVLVAVNLVFTGAMIIGGYLLYPRVLGKPYPLTMVFTFLGLNAVTATGLTVINAMVGGVAPLFGYSFSEGFAACARLLLQVYAWGQQVPTIPQELGIHVPGWLAFFLVMMTGGFFHYWFHRLAHESRLLWLLFHRQHHMTPELIHPTTQGVITAFPLFLLAAIPYVLIFSVLGKLVTNESIITYLIVFKLISAFANMFSHQTAMYSWAHKQRWIRVLSTITSEGVYHYLHHSREAEHNESHGNVVNIGGGLFFFWDRVFGTYRKVTAYRPRVGLQNVEPEALSTNPLRLAFAGISQLGYELAMNRGLKARWNVVTGPSDYVPPVSHDFALKPFLPA